MTATSANAHDGVHRHPAEDRHGNYVMLADRTTWPDPSDRADLEWELRYAEPTRENVLAAASFIHAYRSLIALPQRERNKKIALLRRAAVDER